MNRFLYLSLPYFNIFILFIFWYTVCCREGYLIVIDAYFPLWCMISQLSLQIAARNSVEIRVLGMQMSGIIYSHLNSRNQITRQHFYLIGTERLNIWNKEMQYVQFLLIFFKMFSSTLVTVSPEKSNTFVI